jgi:hypothetical protein
MKLGQQIGVGSVSREIDLSELSIVYRCGYPQLWDFNFEHVPASKNERHFRAS